MLTSYLAAVRYLCSMGARMQVRLAQHTQRGVHMALHSPATVPHSLQTARRSYRAALEVPMGRRRRRAMQEARTTLLLGKGPTEQLPLGTVQAVGAADMVVLEEAVATPSQLRPSTSVNVHHR